DWYCPEVPDLVATSRVMTSSEKQASYNRNALAGPATLVAPGARGGRLRRELRAQPRDDGIVRSFRKHQPSGHQATVPERFLQDLESSGDRGRDRRRYHRR